MFSWADEGWSRFSNHSKLSVRHSFLLSKIPWEELFPNSFLGFCLKESFYHGIISNPVLQCVCKLSLHLPCIHFMFGVSLKFYKSHSTWNISVRCKFCIWIIIQPQYQKHAVTRVQTLYWLCLIWKKNIKTPTIWVRRIV